jgi:hypothetical protein
MFRYFKSLFTLVFIITIFVDSNAKDLLKNRILKYNNINIDAVSPKTIDSAKILLPIHFFNKTYESKYFNHLIHKKKSSSNYIIFSFLLLTLILSSLVRFSFVNNFSLQYKNFFSLKSKILEDFEFFKILAFHIFYFISIAYLIFIFLSKNKIVDYNVTFYIYIFGYVAIFLSLRRVINFIIFYIFDLKSLKKSILYISNDMIVLSVMFLIPLFIFESISGQALKSSLLFVSIVLFFLLIGFRYFKILYNNFNLILSNFFTILIYFLAIEVLPLILLAQYFKLNNYL